MRQLTKPSRAVFTRTRKVLDRKPRPSWHKPDSLEFTRQVLKHESCSTMWNSSLCASIEKKFLLLSRSATKTNVRKMIKIFATMRPAIGYERTSKQQGAASRSRKRPKWFKTTPPSPQRSFDHSTWRFTWLSRQRIDGPRWRYSKTWRLKMTSNYWIKSCIGMLFRRGAPEPAERSAPTLSYRKILRNDAVRTIVFDVSCHMTVISAKTTTLTSKYLSSFPLESICKRLWTTFERPWWL